MTNTFARRCAIALFLVLGSVYALAAYAAGPVQTDTTKAVTTVQVLPGGTDEWTAVYHVDVTTPGLAGDQFDLGAEIQGVGGTDNVEFLGALFAYVDTAWSPVQIGQAGRLHPATGENLGALTNTPDKYGIVSKRWVYTAPANYASISFVFRVRARSTAANTWTIGLANGWLQVAPR